MVDGLNPHRLRHLTRQFSAASRFHQLPLLPGIRMDDYARALNAGSSSRKFCVYRRPAAETWEARDQIEDIGTSPRLSAKGTGGQVLVEERLGAGVSDGRAALDALAFLAPLKIWWRAYFGCWPPRRAWWNKVRPACSRNRQVLTELHELVPVAPLHQPHNLAAIEAIFERMPDVPQVACFDASFHRGHAPVAEVIPLPREICTASLQRYGFHGLSYEYIASVLPEVAPKIVKRRVTVAHLGSGAIREEVEAILHKKSGVLGILGISSDMRDLLAGANQKPVWPWTTSGSVRPRKSALWPQRWAVSMDRCSPGIGENSLEMPQRVCEALCMAGRRTQCGS